MSLTVWKKDIITGLVVLATFLFFIITPAVPALGSAVQGFILMLIFFGLLPLGYHFLVLRRPKEELGITLGNPRQGLVLALLLAAAGFLLSILLLRIFPDFWNSYALPIVVRESFGWFLLHELILVPVIIIFFELFFRGFLQFSWLHKRLGLLAVLAQSCLFFVFLFATNSVSWNTAPLLLFSLVSGFLMNKTESLLYPFLATWVYILLLDVYFLVLS